VLAAQHRLELLNDVKFLDHCDPMIDPGFESYLVEVIVRTGVERYRYLSTEQPDLAERAKWQRWVIDKATAPFDAVHFLESASSAGASASETNRPCCDGQAYPSED
jgi:hypothetical protein